MSTQTLIAPESTVYYRAPNRKRYVQLGTNGKRGWLLTNGPASDICNLRQRHHELVMSARRHDLTLAPVR